jgi:hypothetical protein
LIWFKITILDKLGQITMKFGFRIPSITKRIAAQTSVTRIVQNKLGLKVPRGLGWVINLNKFVYNKIYNKTSKGCMITLLFFIAIPIVLILLILK